MGSMVRLQCRRGEAHPNAKLNAALVREIRASKEPTEIIAARLNVSTTRIKMVRLRKAWTHVE